MPKIARRNNCLTGTPEEFAAIMRRSIWVFGSYSINEEKDGHLQDRVGVLPELAGRGQERSIDKLTADEFVNTNHNVAGGSRQRVELL